MLQRQSQENNQNNHSNEKRKRNAIATGLKIVSYANQLFYRARNSFISIIFILQKINSCFISIWILLLLIIDQKTQVTKSR